MHFLRCLAAALLLPAAAVAFDSVVTFNEVHYNPAGTGEDGEWIELHNLNGVDVDVSGWRLSGGVDFTFPAGTVIRGRGHLVIARNPTVAAIPGALGPWTGALSNAGELVRLRDNNDRIMDELEYGDKGAWPVAPDGSGATLAKRRGEGSSRDAAAWTFSTSAGGTPGAINFPLPAGPVTSNPIGFRSPWRHWNAGTAPAGNWNLTSFDDAAWPEGPGAFTFNATSLFMESAPVAAGGYWTTLRWTNDATSEVASTRTYTHRVALNRSTAVNAINGVAFSPAGSGVTSGAGTAPEFGWRLLGATIGFTGNGSGGGANNLPAGSGSRQLCEEFLYGATHTGGVSRLELTGLQPGTHYLTTFYTTGFGAAEGRRVRITPSDSNVPVQIDENATGSGNGLLVRYHFKCPASGEIAFDFLPLTGGATWHHYAFSNEVAPAFPDELPFTGNLTVADFSSQLTSGFTRGAVNAVNGSGLTNPGGVHGTAPDGSMWLTNGTFTAPNDPLPAHLTIDLGAPTDLASLRIWNYNELNLTTRGAQQVEIQTATQPGGPFTTAVTTTLARAFGITSEIGQRIGFPQIATGVRQVRINILSNHGDGNAFAGLSEIRCFVPGSPTTPPPVPLRERITTIYNSGVDDDGRPLAPGLPDPHYRNTANNQQAVAMAPNAAWLQDDGVSRFIGFTGSGSDSVPFGTFTYRTSFTLDDYVPGSAQIRLLAAADNSLDAVRLNGGTALAGATAPGFSAYFGPFTLPGPFPAGPNTVDFTWTNAGTAPNPGGIRIRWDATAEPLYSGTVLAANPTTTWFRRRFTLTGAPGTLYSAVLQHAVDDGAVFYLNGVEIHRTNLPAGALAPSTAALTEVTHPMISSRIPVSGAMLQPGENVLAVELHQAATGPSDAWFMASLSVTGTAPPAGAGSLQLEKIAGATAGTFTVDLVNASGGTVNLTGHLVRGSGGQEFALTGTLAAGARLSLTEAQLGFRPLDGDKLFLLSGGGSGILDAAVVKNRPQARMASGAWATPSALNPGGDPAFSIPDSVVINEIMYHHHPVTLPTGTTDDPEEWIELFNRGTSAVDLNGWKVRGGIAFDFPAGTTLAPGAYLVVAKDPGALLARFPGISVTGPFSGTLSNRGDVVQLEDPSDNIADEVRYCESGRWDGRADGGGSSLELRDPDADNSVPESWAASDESARSTWQTFTWSGTGAPFAGTNDPAQFNEFILGLLNDGECLIDDVRVRETAPTPRDLIQNGSFATGLTSWRAIGNHGSHGRTVIQDDPSAPGNPVLRLVATGATEHMHNQCQTTLKSGATFVTLSSTATYEISFRARWISGTPRLLARLYFNRLARQCLLPVPVATGTPGAPNSRRTANIGPSLTELAHAPAVPLADQSAAVSVRASDPDGVAAVALRWRLDGAPTFASIPMAGGPAHSASLPAQPGGSLVEFYVEATDTLGAVSRYPASGALVRWSDGTAPPGPGHGLRILMTTANADFMHRATNVMSNDPIPCTVVYQEREVFYDAGCRLKSSQRGRLADIRLGFYLAFDPMQPFRGVMKAVNLDRSSYGRGSPGSGYGHGEIINWHFFNRAGGVPSMYNDMVYLIAPRSVHTGSSTLTMAEFNDPWLDGQYDNGADTPTFKYELIYWPTTTEGGTPEGLKLPQPDNVNAVTTSQITSPDKEAYRWNFLIGNARNDDDYTRIINMGAVFRQTGAAYTQNLPQAIDVDQWLRCFAAFALAGPGDHYTTAGGGWHNLKLYHRRDGRILFLPWDGDFLTEPSNAALVRAPDLSKMIGANPAWERAFYGHINDIINRSFNDAYIESWANHYQTFSTTGGNWAEITTYVRDRAAFARSQINSLFPAVTFAITTNSGNDFSTANPTTTITGEAGLDVRSLRINGAAVDVPVTWSNRRTWSISLPVAAGPNPFTIEAIDYAGAVAATDTITVTGTGSIVPASAANLVVSELHYNPAASTDPTFADPDDFEFVELRNISGDTVTLTGVRFVAGITWTAPAGTLIPPGGRVVIPRRTAAFATRHPGVATLPEYYVLNANVLSNAGEEVALVDAAGDDIKRFSYDDNSPWPTAADGDGMSLVLIAPTLNPEHNDPLNWRASTAIGGNPGTSDAATPPADPGGDSDGDGLTNLMEHITGGTRPLLSAEPNGFLEAVFDRAAGVEGQPILETAPGLSGWLPQPATIVNRSRRPDGSESLTIRAATPPGQARLFLRLRFRTP